MLRMTNVTNNTKTRHKAYRALARSNAFPTLDGPYLWQYVRKVTSRFAYKSFS